MVKVAQGEAASAVINGVDIGAITASGSLGQEMQLEVARTRMLKQQMDAQGEAALELIRSVAPNNTSSDVGRTLNIVA